MDRNQKSPPPLAEEENFDLEQIKSDKRTENGGKLYDDDNNKAKPQEERSKMDGETDDVKVTCEHEMIPGFNYIPYISVYDDKKQLCRRGHFIPAFNISASIVDMAVDRTRVTRFRSPYVYTIEVKHGSHRWEIKRRYADFQILDRKLRYHRMRANLFSARQRAAVSDEIILPYMKDNGLAKCEDEKCPSPTELCENPTSLSDSEVKDCQFDERCYHEKPHGMDFSENRLSTLWKKIRGASTTEDITIVHEKDVEKKKRAQILATQHPEFPSIPDSMVHDDQLIDRKEQLQRFLSDILRIRAYWDHPAMVRFLGVSRFSFVHDLGIKRKEDRLKMRPGSFYWIRKFLDRCGRFCYFLNWRKSWLIVKDSVVIHMNNRDGQIYDVMLLDSDFDVYTESEYPGDDRYVVKTGLVITNKHMNMILKCKTADEALNWSQAIKHVMTGSGKIWCEKHRFDSSYPIRPDTYAQWLVDGRAYMEHVAKLIESAKEEILISAWWLHPRLYLKRPMSDNELRLDFLLKRKADQGVRIFILIYKEFPGSMAGARSSEAETYLMNLNKNNIKILRHPDFVKGNTVLSNPLWSHHEKFVVVDQTMATSSGIDLCYGRWDDYHHRLTDLKDKGFMFWPGKEYLNLLIKDVEEPSKPFEDILERTKVPRSPWHDMGCVVYGAAARDIARNFIQRWNEAKRDVKADSKAYPFLLPKTYEEFRLPETFKKHSVPCNVQVLRSACAWSVGQARVEEGIHKGFLDIIDQAQHYVYMESPFYMSHGENEIINGVNDALYNRIIKAHQAKEKFRVFIIIPLLPGCPKDSGMMMVQLHYTMTSISKGPNSLLRKLEEELGDPSEYISFCGLRNHAELCGQLVTEMVYPHSKMILADDRRCIIGSANLNDRSLLGDRDSELAVIVEDTNFVDSKMNRKAYKSGAFCGSLRRRLFNEHLGITDEEDKGIDITDPISDEFYNLWKRIAERNTKIYEEVFRCSPSNRIQHVEEWNHVEEAKNLIANSDKEKSIKLLKEVQGHLVTFPTEFLSQSDLLNDKGAMESYIPSYAIT